MIKTIAHNILLGHIMTTRNLSPPMLTPEVRVARPFVNRAAKRTVETLWRSNMQRLAKYLGIPVDCTYPDE